jgi:hypothetical protein
MSRGRKPATGKVRQARDSAATAGQQHAAGPGAASGQDSLAFGFGSRRRYLDRAIYTTITIMSVLIVYDGWQDLKFWAAAGVILGPVLAMFVSHVFSAFLARQAELHERPGRREQTRIIRTELRFLLLAAPALALLVILTVAGVSLANSIQAIIFAEGASLGFWGFAAGRRAGLTGWPLTRTVAFGLIVGLVVLALQVFLQPGNASLVA